MRFIDVKLVIKVAGMHHMISRFQKSSVVDPYSPPPPPPLYNTRTFGTRF